MKILRKRRGFTTNSSGSSEWLPSKTPPGSVTPGSQTPTAGNNQFTLGTETLKPVPVYIITPQETQINTALNNPANNNLAKIGVIGAVVLVAVMFERFIRYILKKKKIKHDE